MKTNLRPFCRALRSMGFALQFRDRDVAQFQARVGDRAVTVQLWNDGLRRVSHGAFSKIKGRDCLHECTTPAEFKTLPQMFEAIAREWTRPSTVVPGRRP